MSEVPTGEGACGIRPRSANAAAFRTANWLCLAAAPTFAIMALLTIVLGAGETLCSAALHASPLSGMGVMYLLMSAFHSGPWLRLVSDRRNGALRSESMRTNDRRRSR